MTGSTSATGGANREGNFAAYEQDAGEGASSNRHEAYLFSVRRARVGIQTHPLATLAICLAPGFGERQRVFAATIFGLSVITALVRWWAVRYLLKLPIITLRHWITLLVIPVVLANGLWALEVGVMLWQGPLDTGATLVLLGSVALAFGCVVSYTPHRALAIGLLLIHLGLPFLSTLRHRENLWMLLGLLLIAFMLYVLRIANSLHADYWSAVATRNHLNHARQRAEAANRAKDQFLANISHEIRTPLNGIAAPAELLQQSALNPMQQQLLQLMTSSAHTLSQLIDDILDFAKIEEGKFTLVPQAFSVTALLSDICGRHRLSAEAKGLALRETTAADCWLLGDPLRIGQIIDNLLSNAIKFTDRGSVNIGTRLEKIRGAQHLVVVVADTGCGIAKPLREKIFQPFVQGDGSTTRRFGGTGLGLSISRRLAEQMQGKLNYTSTENVGSCFTLILPLPPAEPSIKPLRAQSPQRFADLRVLVAEDNQVNQQVIRHQLQALGITDTTVVGDGQQALAALSQQRYDLVFLDCQMPVLDGYATVAQLRREPGLNADVPVIALTAHALTGDLQRALAAGMNDYLSKPVSLPTLAHTIAQWWGDKNEGAGEEERRA